MTETALERFAGWLSADVGPVLRRHGFTKAGSTFHLRGEAGWGVVNLQKDRYGSQLGTRFTVNLGVALDRLSEWDGRDPRRKPPEFTCHWRFRIGQLLDHPKDTWWDLDQRTELSRLTAAVLPVLVDRGLPLIRASLSEAGFVAAIRSNPDLGRVWPPLARILEILGRDVDMGDEQAPM